MKNIFTITIYSILFLSINLKAQEEQSSIQNYSGGLSFHGGIGYIAVKDEFISKEKYSGIAPLFIASWAKNYNDYKFHLLFEILSSAKIKNHNISAQVTELSLNLSYLYSIGKLNIFNKDAHFFLGPLPELFIHYRSENIAKGGDALFDAYSFASLFSVGSKLNVTIQLNDLFLLEGNLQTTILSLGGKYIDPKDNEMAFLIFTTLFKNLRASFESSIRYMMTSNLSLTAGYKFNVVNMSSWDYLISANDNFLISITYSF